MVFYKGNVFAFGGYSPRDPSSDEIIDQLDSRRLFREVSAFMKIFCRIMAGFSIE